MKQSTAVGAEALMPGADAPQQSVTGDGLVVAENRAADAGRNDAKIPQSRSSIPSQMMTRDSVEIGPNGGHSRGPGPSQGQRSMMAPQIGLIIRGILKWSQHGMSGVWSCAAMTAKL